MSSTERPLTTHLRTALSRLREMVGSRAPNGKGKPTAPCREVGFTFDWARLDSGSRYMAQPSGLSSVDTGPRNGFF
jgi:hypothetical protein